LLSTRCGNFQYVALEIDEGMARVLVFATGLRVGLAHAPGGTVPFSERFFAGGCTTLRGFEQNAVGPIRADGIPLGGEGILSSITNCDSRWRGS